MEFTTQLIEKSMEVCINININKNFNFNFNNVQNIPARNKSPSQIKRNYLRQKAFKNKKKENLPDVKKEAIDKKVKNVETQTEDISSETNFTQTEEEVGSNTQTNTDKMNVETQTISNESKTEEVIEVN